MGLAATTHHHIALDDDGTPIVVDANTKVVELVSEMHVYGWSPAELHFQHPHLSLGEIHSALAYYWDHQQQIDSDRRRRFVEAEELRKGSRSSPAIARLRHPCGRWLPAEGVDQTRS